MLKQAIAASLVALLLGPNVLAAKKTAPAKAGTRERAEVVAEDIALFMDKSPKRIERTGATFIAPHFARVALLDGDTITVHGPEAGSRSYTYNRLSTLEGRYAIAIPGTTAIIDLNNASGKSSYEIDKYSAGMDPPRIAARNQPQTGFLEICGADDSQEAKCITGTPYDTSRAVARLLINGKWACTGWLVGPGGHLITNHHCISSAADAANVQVEFMAEGASCPTNCDSWFGCPGNVVATSAQFVTANAKNDYAVIKLDPSVAQQYGYFRLRRVGPRKDEPIYIPQHPRGAGKRIVVKSSDPKDAAGPTPGMAHINTLEALACSGVGASEVGYNADTDPGASGSPVVATADNLVVALHHCGGCPNHAIPIDRIAKALAKVLPSAAFGQ
jgi:V8-like Glu-specific endopeptidase